MIEFIYIILLIVLHFIFIPFIWLKFERTFEKQKRQKKSSKLIRFVYNEQNKCTMINCLSNHDCFLECGGSSGGGDRFVCHHGLCIPGKQQQALKKEEKRQRCFPSRGVVAVLQGDSELISTSWRCISIFPHLIDDRDGNKKPGVCDGGEFTINLGAHYPRIEDCVCSQDRKLITFSGRKSGDIRSSKDIPRCVFHEFLYV